MKYSFSGSTVSHQKNTDLSIIYAENANIPQNLEISTPNSESAIKNNLESTYKPAGSNHRCYFVALCNACLYSVSMKRNYTPYIKIVVRTCPPRFTLGSQTSGYNPRLPIHALKAKDYISPG